MHKSDYISKHCAFFEELFMMNRKGKSKDFKISPDGDDNLNFYLVSWGEAVYLYPDVGPHPLVNYLDLGSCSTDITLLDTSVLVEIRLID